MDVIKPKEVLRARDMYLIKWNCLKCNEELLTGFDAFCVSCGWEPEKSVIDFSDAKGRNIVAIPDANRRGYLGRKKIRQLYDEQEGKCAYCFTFLGITYHIDHIIPLTAGGTSAITNLAVSCPECNLIASNIYFEDFWSKQAYILEQKRKKLT